MNPRTRRIRRRRRNTRKFLHKIATKTAPPAVLAWWHAVSTTKNYLETILVERIRALRRFKGEIP